MSVVMEAEIEAWLLQTKEYSGPPKAARVKEDFSAIVSKGVY